VKKISFASKVGDRSWNEVGTTDFTATRSMSFKAKLIFLMSAKEKAIHEITVKHTKLHFRE